MHMSDALVSPAVGAAMWVASAAAIALASRQLGARADDRRVPLMGVLGAFLFAAQMINFSIPGTGSSGHLGGGLLLALLLGPHAGFLVIASVLIVQALFFADGGLLALGCNIFNLGFLPAYFVSPAVRRLAGTSPGTARASLAIGVGAVVALQLGAFAVVLQTVASGLSALPFATFAGFMLPIHAAIGIVEGLVTAALLAQVHKSRPDILAEAAPMPRPMRGVLAAFAGAAVLVGGAGAWYSSGDPDGLEWSIERVASMGRSAQETAPSAQAPGTASAHPAQAPATISGAEGGLHVRLARLQQALAFMPDYAFPADSAGAAGVPSAAAPELAGREQANPRWGTSVAGLVGAALSLVLAGLLGVVLRRVARGR